MNEKLLQDVVEIAKKYHFESKTEVETTNDFTLIFKTFIDLAEQFLRLEGFPHKEEHSDGCLYIKAPYYNGKPDKEKYCTCGSFNRNEAIDQCKLAVLKDYVKRSELPSKEENLDSDIAQERYERINRITGSKK